MSSPDIDMREFLENKDLLGFLKLYAAQGQVLMAQPSLGSCTQRLLPALCREKFAADAVLAEEVVLLWRLIRCGTLLLVDNDIRSAINARIELALSPDQRASAGPTLLLPLYSDAPLERKRPIAPPSMSAAPKAVPMERVVLCSSYCVGFYGMSDSVSYKKNLCASSQESEFLKAVRQFFPGLRAYPNVPLRNFIDLDALDGVLDQRLRRFCWSSLVDVLLCTEDEDPVAGIELDSAHHDTETAQECDALKNKLFAIAGVPLVRIRAANTSNVRAEDFFDLMLAKSEELSALRPRQLRPRRNHDVLVPMGYTSRVTSVHSQRAPHS